MSQTTIKKIRSEFKKLKKIHNEFEAQSSFLEKILEEKIEFDFFIQHQPSDGFVIVHRDDDHNGLFYPCLKIIEEKGSLSIDDYLLECI